MAQSSLNVIKPSRSINARKKTRYNPTGENPSGLISLGIVFEVRRVHRNLDPPAEIVTLPR
jgi:hypothetical protein